MSSFESPAGFCIQLLCVSTCFRALQKPLLSPELNHLATWSDSDDADGLDCWMNKPLKAVGQH